MRLRFIMMAVFVLAACSPTETSPTPLMTEQPTQTAAAPAATVELTQEETPMASNGEADANVTYVEAIQADDGTWTFRVTVEHPDTGWEDYADGWDVVLPDGTVLKPDPDSPFTRLLLHPHVEEQPFTRSQSGITIPEDVTEVQVRAHDIVDGWGGQVVTVDLTTQAGDNYEVQRDG